MNKRRGFDKTLAGLEQAAAAGERGATEGQVEDYETAFDNFERADGKLWKAVVAYLDDLSQYEETTDVDVLYPVHCYFRNRAEARVTTGEIVVQWGAIEPVSCHACGTGP